MQSDLWVYSHLLFDQYCLGTLAPSWGAMSKLRLCSLFNNTLSGPLPGAWSGMAALEDLRLSGNALTGGVRIKG